MYCFFCVTCPQWTNCWMHVHSQHNREACVVFLSSLSAIVLPSSSLQRCLFVYFPTEDPQTCAGERFPQLCAGTGCEERDRPSLRSVSTSSRSLSASYNELIQTCPAIPCPPLQHKKSSYCPYWEEERVQSVAYEFLTIILEPQMDCNTTKVTFQGPLGALEVEEETLNPLHSCIAFIMFGAFHKSFSRFSFTSARLSVVFDTHVRSLYIPFCPSCCGETLNVRMLRGRVIEIITRC